MFDGIDRYVCEHGERGYGISRPEYEAEGANDKMSPNISKLSGQHLLRHF